MGTELARFVRAACALALCTVVAVVGPRVAAATAAKSATAVRASVATGTAAVPWRAVADPLPPAAQPLDVTCPSAEECVAVGDTYGDIAPSILTTSDGGATWQVRSAPPRTLALGLVSCGSASSCLAIGSYGIPPSVIRTTDGGATWSS